MEGTDWWHGCKIIKPTTVSYWYLWEISLICDERWCLCFCSELCDALAKGVWICYCTELWFLTHTNWFLSVQSCALYWPEEYGYTVEYDPLSIELLSSTEDNNVSIRIFKLSNRIKVHLPSHSSLRDFMSKDYCICIYRKCSNDTHPFFYQKENFIW